MLAEHISRSGMRQKEWAERFGISQPYLSDLLRGNRTPSLEVAVRIERETQGAVPAVSWIPEAA